MGILEKLKGLRTYATLIIIAILGLLVQVQTSCANDVSLADVCGHLPMKYIGIAVTGLTAIAAWFRKLAGSGK